MKPEYTGVEPDEETVAAVVSAAVIEILSRRRVVETKVAQDSVAWRFSGRWWNQPIAIGRRRPNRF